MAERRRRVEDMTTAVDTLIKYQKTFNKKYTQEEAGDLVQEALMRDRAETIFLTNKLSVLVWVWWLWSVRVSRKVMCEIVLELG